MKVVFSNGNQGNISDKDSKNLSIQNRFTKEEWQNLEDEMTKLDIIKFEDPFVKQLGGDLVSIKYVRNQIKSHSY